VKVIAEGKEEPADDEVLGFITAINLHRHRDARFAKQLRDSYIKRCADGTSRSKLTALLDDPTSGLVFSERMVNLPAALIPSLVDALLQDLAWAVDNVESADERSSFRFEQLLMVAPCELNGAGGSGGASSSTGEPEGVGAGKKKRKRAAADAHAALMETVVFGRVEEEILAGAAEWCTVLNGTGRQRQVVMLLRADAIKGAIPALHNAMGEQ
jgi:hypothetical protein